MVQTQNELKRARELLLSGNAEKAIVLYEKLTRTSPGSAVIWDQCGNAAFKARKTGLAQRAWDKAVALEPRNAELIGLIGHQFQAARQPDKAKACFLQAAGADPKGINARISLAVLLERSHDVAQAREMVEQCFAINPQDDQARFFSALLDRRERKFDHAETKLRDLIASEPRHPYVQYAARYELAQIFDQSNQVDDAMRLLAEAKQIVTGLTDTEALIKSYDENARRTRQFTDSQPKDILHQWAKFFPPNKREKIQPLAFLGGHPRSGTTLLEQVLDAHPEICALDEPTALLDVLQPAFHKTSQHSSQRLNFLRRLYIGALLDETGPSGVGKLLLDKNPSPTARLPAWLRVFPELRVMIALRDPRDVIISCYFQNIPLNTVNVNFLRLDRLVRHYSGLMDVWRTVRGWDGFQWIETRYEDLVANLEGEGRRVTEFLGLQWQSEQAAFHESSRSKHLYSPTYQDVTRPVYRNSVARWRRYEKHLAPILPALEPYCRAFGYE